MQILELKIDEYKFLKDFDITFDISENGSSTIIIGENGTGKSTLLEVMLRILASFDSPAVAIERNFNFYLKYLYAGENIILQRQGSDYSLSIEGANYFISGNLVKLRKALQKDGKEIFPKRVVIFYSGGQNNLLPIYRKVDKYYAQNCRKTVINYINYISSKKVDEIFEIDFPDRKYNYCYDSMTSIYLASILLDNSQDSVGRRILLNDCHFDKVERIEIMINLKKLNHMIKIENDNQKVPVLFWDILTFIESSFVEIFRSSSIFRSKDSIHFTLSELDLINIDRISIFNTFEKLSTLFDAQFDVTVKNGESVLQVSEMSEGQQQLIRILGMLGLFKNEDSFVIMDEPDAHMNPKWKYDLKDIIDECLKSATNTQALIATHDPLVINGVGKEFVRIFNFEMISGYYRPKVHIPTEDTKGMGIDGLLQSEYYGLQTSYDKETSEKYIRRQELYIKLINENITNEEKKELREFTTELGSLPLSTNTIDFIYDDFIKEYKNSEYYTKEYLTFDDVVARRIKIKDIINKLFEGN